MFHDEVRVNCVRSCEKELYFLLTIDQDRASRRFWRSETLDALAHSPDFDRRQNKQIEILSDELIHIIRVIDNSLLTRECVESLQSKIIVPVVHLAYQLHDYIYPIVDITSGSARQDRQMRFEILIC